MMYHFSLKPSEQGLVLAAGSAAGTVSNIFFVGPLLYWLGSHRAAVLAMIAILCACMVAYSFTGKSTLWLFYSLVLPKSAAAAVLMTLFTALFSYSVPAQQVGTVIAIAHAES